MYIIYSFNKYIKHFLQNILKHYSGIGNYAKQLIFLRMIGHLKFAHVRLDLIKITMHPEEATVKVRWRIRGVTGFRMFFAFWKYKVWKIRDSVDRDHEL